MSTLANKLQKARNEKKLSMTQVARKSVRAGDVEHRGHITQGYISRLESGKEANLSFLKLKMLCRIYGIEPGSLF